MNMQSQAYGTVQECDPHISTCPSRRRKWRGERTIL